MKTKTHIVQFLLSLDIHTSRLSMSQIQINFIKLSQMRTFIALYDVTEAFLISLILRNKSKGYIEYNPMHTQKL